MHIYVLVSMAVCFEEYGDVTFLQQSLQIGSEMLLVSLVSFWCTLYVESSDGDLLVDVFLCVCEMGIHCLHPEVLQSLLEELWLWCSFYFGLCFFCALPFSLLALRL